MASFWPVKVYLGLAGIRCSAVARLKVYEGFEPGPTSAQLCTVFTVPIFAGFDGATRNVEPPSTS